MNEEVTTLFNEFLNIGVKLIIAIIGVWFSTIVIPWLKEQKIYTKIQKLVKAAEKKGESGAIPKESKKTFVVTMLEICGIEVTKEIDAMIESAVEELDELTTYTIGQLAETEDTDVTQEAQSD